MDKAAAQKLVRETLQGSFNKEHFVSLIKNLLNRVEEAPFTYKGQYIFDDFRDSIKLVERIGKYKGPDEKLLDILVIHLQKETSLERARTKQRNFVSKYLKGSRGGMLKDAALVAFVAPDSENWRFSFIKMEYKFNEKGKVEEEFTPARRYSFLVGKHETSHTAQSRLLPLLLDDESQPTLQNIEDAFSVEKATKEFFEKYRALFIRLKETLDKIVKKDPRIKAEFENKKIDTVDFAKNLLGQIVFLYFLQKKGWFGVGRDDDWGSGSKHFLRELFQKKHADYKNFFNDILESLFYEALRNDRSHDDDYYSRFNCKIPFLNGGLFDPIGHYDWVHTDIDLPNALFSNTRLTKEGDTGDGILDVFDRYNFTVREDEPLEKEVAIDPELLGKAYEKFNAIRPDNFNEYLMTLKSGNKGEENKFNKKYGVYYTPREIVHYMCQQSLINYLATELEGQIDKNDLETLIHTGEQVSENEARVLREGRETDTYSHKLPGSVCIPENAALIDQKLIAITVCDPAVGSGAFPVGMMNEIVRARRVLSLFLNDKTRNDYEYKRHCIEHSLYGVDIDPGAVEIAKLRLWLSLVVDETDIKNIKPLPNLDYRIMQGNSLITEFIGINFDADKPKNSENLMFKDKTDELIELFQQKKDEFLNESNVSRKAKLKEEVENLLVEIFETKLRTQRADYFRRLENIENKYAALPNKKDRDEMIKKEKEKLYKTSGLDPEAAKIQLKELSSDRRIKPFFLWNLYFSEVFHNKGGFDVTIGNPPYIALQKNGGELRRLYQDAGFTTFASTGDVYQLFYERGCQLLMPSSGLLAYITSNSWLKAEYGKSTRRYFSDNHTPLRLIELGKDIFESAIVDSSILIARHGKHDETGKAVDMDRLPDKDFPPAENRWAVFHPQSEKPWGTLSAIEQSIMDKMEAIGTPLKEWNVSIYRGVTTGLNDAFIIDDATKRRLLAADPKSAKIIKPVLRGRDIQRYQAQWANLWLIDTHNGYGGVPAININDYPAIKTHLDGFYPQLKERQDKGKTPYNLRNCAYHDEFAKEKLFWADMAKVGRFVYSVKEIYCNNKGYILTGNSLKYLCAVLNSSLITWLIKNTAATTGMGLTEWTIVTIERIPIPKTSPTEQRPFINLVNTILKAKAANPKADTTEQEAQIDRLVYELYGLTTEKIAAVEQ